MYSKIATIISSSFLGAGLKKEEEMVSVAQSEYLSYFSQ